MTLKFRYQKLPFIGHDSTKPLVARPYVPVYLIGNAGRTPSPYYALLDSGADRVIFPSELADTIGISDFTSGRHEPTMGIGSQSVDVFFHPLKIQLMGGTQEMPTAVGFADSFTTALLGRTFFQHFKSVVFEENREQVELRW